MRSVIGCWICSLLRPTSDLYKDGLMGLPKRLNLIRIVLEQLNPAGTFIDSDFREQIGAKQRTAEVVVRGQINLGLLRGRKLKETARSMTGDQEKSKGRIYFRRADLKALGVTIKKGDRVLRAGPVGDEVSIDGVVIQIRPEAPLRGTFLLDVIEFEHDREERESVV